MIDAKLGVCAIQLYMFMDFAILRFELEVHTVHELDEVHLKQAQGAGFMTNERIKKRQHVLHSVGFI